LGDLYEITQAASLQEARSILMSKDFDLILLDIGLPDGSGLDLIESIGKLASSPQVLIFSADEIKTSQNKDVAGSLGKSSTTNEELVSNIQTVVNHL